MPSTCLLIEPHFFPCIAYFVRCWPYDTICLEVFGTYQKQTYNNRCYIKTAHNVDRLTVPVVGGKKKLRYQEIRIDHQQNWARHHWRALCTAYGRAPYFLYFAGEIYDLLFSDYIFLYQLNVACLKLCWKLLQVPKATQLTEKYQIIPSQEVFDARYQILPCKNNAPATCCPASWYPQVFGTTFVPNLSILDVLFCQGPEAVEVLQKSIFY